MLSYGRSDYEKNNYYLIIISKKTTIKYNEKIRE